MAGYSARDCEILRKFCPDCLERGELPPWFVQMADSRSKGKMAFAVFDKSDVQEFVHVDYFYDGEFLETKIFRIKLKK